MSMSSDITQLRSSFFFSSLVAMFLVGITCLIGILMLTVNPNLDPSNLWIYIIDNYTSPGLKGFAIIGIISMIMSTADCVSRVQRMFTRSLKCRENLYVTI